ncbi:MAG: phenylalanine--tRNA ligase subunit beta [Actinobacteria bacterium]|nr:phenylalanine--tRNA ligase subunit beta [Actinomycetota bacterium]MBU1609056.1 phenylalanine--tRNA ligase subunit beta [Actinomycetota bacterium]MBU2316594.1 phenylalanine--tRNA ligase subunit beta [Actinomycetota bacterium]MBU2384812.1 phenylalanine--tRNA ligase subunit beta [Actinomycetota bacterium]
MRVPLSWLREFVEVPASGDPLQDAAHVHAALVRVGLEEEDVHGVPLTGPIVVGEVLEFIEEPQSNGKTIRWCQVRTGTLPDGEPEVHGIVCGAPNFHAGDKVVVALPGSVLPGPFPISARKTYGHLSDGMIASARELGLGEEHDGILRLAELELDPEVGTDAIALLGLDDVAVEVNVTPDRGYTLSLRGIAREYSNSTGAVFRDPASSLEIGVGEGFSVTIDDQAPVRGRRGCDVFVTRAVRGIDPTRPSPPWMVARLTLAGIRSISLTVDITNYVMLELGQPIHAYDLARLQGGIVVRRAAPGETLVTLDDQSRTLDAEDLLITDGSGPVGIAGVMGGASTEVSDATTDVLIEAANFEPVTIARSARRHKLPSEASKRFARGVDPLVAEAAAQRVVDLLVELAGGAAVDLGSAWVESTRPASIDLAEGYVDNLVGVDFSLDEITDSLVAVGCTVSPGDDGWRVTPPSWRPDLIDAPSLAEEVARIVGYDRIPAQLPVAPPGRGLSRGQRARRAIADALAAAGLTEVLAYPFVSAADNALMVGDEHAQVRLANALDAEAARLRVSLLPGLADIAHRNVSRGLTDLALFEIGTVFLPESGREYGVAEVPIGTQRPAPGPLAELEQSIPHQPWHVSALVLGDRRPRGVGQTAEPAGLADVLDAAHRIAAVVGVSLVVETGSHPALHPGRTAALLVDGEQVGLAGELLPAVAIERDLPRRVGVLELDLNRLLALSTGQVAAGVIAGYPAATQDLSVVVPVETPAGAVRSAIVEGAGALLEEAVLVDDYRGEGLEPGTKSITFALRFRAADRTLTAAEATEAKTAGLAVATERFGAQLRA